MLRRLLGKTITLALLVSELRSEIKKRDEKIKTLEKRVQFFENHVPFGIWV